MQQTHSISVLIPMYDQRPAGWWKQHAATMLRVSLTVRDLAAAKIMTTILPGKGGSVAVAVCEEVDTLPTPPAETPPVSETAGVEK